MYLSKKQLLTRSNIAVEFISIGIEIGFNVAIEVVRSKHNVLHVLLFYGQ